MKKIFTILLSAILLFSATGASARFADTEGLPCEEAVSVLNSLGIIRGDAENKFNPDSSLTRAELTAFILRLCGGVATEGEDIFSDVPSSHWAYAEIGAAYRMDIVDGIGEGFFAPDEKASFEQAVKMVVSALGYTPYAESLGGYPAGYLTKATQLELLKGVGTGNAGDFQRRDMAILLYNALDVPLMEKISYGTESGRYEEKADKTVLSYLGIERVKDTVNANFFTSLTGEDNAVKRNEVLIGNTLLHIGKTNADALLGHDVTAYTKNDSADETPVIVSVVPNKNSTAVTVDAEYILPETTLNSFVYEEAGKEEKVQITGAKVVLNGSVKDNPTLEDICPEMGTITLIFNKDRCALIMVENIKNYIVSGKNADTNTLFFTDGSAVELDTMRAGARVHFVDIEGAPITVADCRSGDVITIAKGENVIRAIRSRETAMGRVYEQNDTEIRIEETFYKLDKNVNESYLGIYADYLLDYTGRVVGVDKHNMIRDEYGVIIHAMDGKGLSGSTQIKILTESGEVRAFDTAEKVALNDISTDAADLLKSPLLVSGGTALRQLVRYKTNDEGKISRIETATDYIGKQDDESRYSVFSKDFYVDPSIKANGESIIYQGGTVGVFAGKYKPVDSTKIFIVPETENDDKKCRVYKQNQLLHSSEGGDDFQKNMYFYDINEGNIIGAILILTADGGGITTVPDYLDSMGVVTGISTVMDGDEMKTKIKVLNSQKKEIELMPEEDTNLYFAVSHTDVTKDACAVNGIRKDKITFAELCVGDVIQFSLDAGTGQIKRMNVLYRVQYPSKHEQSWRYYNSGISFYTTEYMNYGSGVMTALGEVKYVTEYGAKTLTKNIAYNKEYERFYSFAGNILIWDTEKECIINQNATYEDIHKGDTILSISSVQRQYYIIVYR